MNEYLFKTNKTFKWIEGHNHEPKKYQGLTTSMYNKKKKEKKKFISLNWSINKLATGFACKNDTSFPHVSCGRARHSIRQNVTSHAFYILHSIGFDWFFFWRSCMGFLQFPPNWTVCPESPLEVNTCVPGVSRDRLRTPTRIDQWRWKCTSSSLS